MINEYDKAEAVDIGNDSWELQNFMALPENASKKRQIEALKSDQAWQRKHIDSVASRIDDLMQRIEG